MLHQALCFLILNSVRENARVCLTCMEIIYIFLFQAKEADLLVQNKALYGDKEQLSQVNNMQLTNFEGITLACVFMFDSRLVHVSQLGLVY